MVSIWVNGEDKTRQISDWDIWWGDKTGELMLTCFFPSGKRYIKPLSDCKIEPTETMQGQLLSKDGGITFSAVDSVIIYGGKYAAVQYRGSEKIYLMNADGISLSPETAIKDGAVFRYFARVAKARTEQADAQGKPITENVQRQLEKVSPHEDTALYAYCTGQNCAREPAINLIYPFGINESQLKAVEHAFTSQISLIEGPPGTGKTQTILNIIANIVLRGKTVAILSNNNAAVENVYEKLGKAELGDVVAMLGNRDNRIGFFETLPSVPSGALSPAPTMVQIQAIASELKRHLHAQNKVAQLNAEISELTIEQRYLMQWQRENSVEPIPLEKYKLSPRKTADLMAYLAHLAERRIRLRDRIELLLKFTILRMKPFDDWEKRRSAIYSLQIHYYGKAIQDKKSELAIYLETLARGNFNGLLEDLRAGSMAYFKQHLHKHIPSKANFDSASYRNQFDEFVRRFPIIGSGTHSIVNSIGAGAILDYIIIDEASMQDIVPGVLPMGCTRNLVIVGDRKQLPHIPVKLGFPPPAEFYDCEKYSLLDSCIGVFKSSAPITLLREHYRCHPKIIQFCNQQFYENQLIPMTTDTGEASLKMLVTAKGNHTRGNRNLRELDSLLETLQWDGKSDWDAENSRGFIAPFNAQVDLSQEHLPSDFVKDTVHKFQGRECNEIVFSTVLDKKRSSQRNLSFVDAPHLVNVAVSRAKNRFTLVTGDDVFTANNGHIAALVRYIEYYADERQIHRAPVVSAFDLLYKEYDSSLERLNARLRSSDSKYKSEQIVAQILRDVLSKIDFQAITFHSQIVLEQLVSVANDSLTSRERDFIRRASCDFVLYFKVGKSPLAVIEVDGGYHGKAPQAERDALKNGILRKSGIALLRLQTVESHIEAKIEKFLAQWMSGASTG